MFRIFALISMILLLVSCTRQGYETIEIIGKESQSNQIVVRGMGVRVSSDQILTSAHVVRDDRLVYEIGGMSTGYPLVRYEVLSRDRAGDRAILSQVQDVKIQTQNPRLQRVQKGDPIYTEVSRSGSIVRIVGKVVDPVGSILGYDTLGRVVTLSGIVLTDIDLQPGDSGAPIYTTQGAIVDVVHVR